MKATKVKKSLEESMKKVCLDQQFFDIPLFLNLKYFKNYSKITQSMGKDYKNICR